MNSKYFNPKIFRGVVENFKFKLWFNFFKRGVLVVKLNLKCADMFRYDILHCRL